MITRIASLLSLTFVFCLTARAAATDTIVAMPFENLSGRAEYNWVGESFAAALGDLLDKPGLVGIRPDERNVAYRQEGLPPTAILTRATMIKIAERAGANLVVIGTYRIAGEGRDSTITVSARVIDIREGRLLGKEFNLGGPLVDMQKLQGDLAYEILYQHNQALPFSRDQITTDATLAPIGAFENFIKGTLASDREARTRFLQNAIKEYYDKNKTRYVPAVFELGRIRYEAAEYKEAVENLSQISERDPRYDESQFYVGVGQAMQGQIEPALATLKKLATRLPLFEVYNNIGVLLTRQKKYKEAIDHLKPAADAATRDTDTLFNLGYAQFLQRDFAAATATLRQETRLKPADGEAFFVIGKALASTGDHPGATAASDQAKKLVSTYAQWETKGLPDLTRLKTSFSKANYYRYKRDQDDRLNAQTQVSTLAPQVELLLQNARVAFDGGRDEDALSALGKVLQSAPQNYDAHLLMGRVYERRGDFERASNALKAAIFWNPRLVAAHVLIGRIAVLKKDCPTAEAEATKALQLDPNDTSAQALRRLVDEKCKANG